MTHVQSKEGQGDRKITASKKQTSSITTPFHEQDKLAWDSFFTRQTETYMEQNTNNLQHFFFTVRMQTEISHGRSEGESLHETHFQREKQCFSSPRHDLSFPLFFHQRRHGMLEFFCHQHHKIVRMFPRAENFTPGGCSCWPGAGPRWANDGSCFGPKILHRKKRRYHHFGPILLSYVSFSVFGMLVMLRRIQFLRPCPLCPRRFRPSCFREWFHALQLSIPPSSFWGTVKFEGEAV